MRTYTKHHNSSDTIRKELRKDIKWFAKHPKAIERSRPPSPRERREWGPDVVEVLVLRLKGGGYATVLFETAHTEEA